MLTVIKNIPDIGKNPLNYVFENIIYKHEPNTLWLEFGVASGKTINYISTYTNDIVYGFDTFTGLPERWRDGFDKGAFNQNGEFPMVNDNITLIKGLFSDTLENFIINHNQKVSFIHIDCDLYSSTKCIFNILKSYICEGCIIIFDELVNYYGYDGNTGELLAFYEFIEENNVKYEWIGMNGIPTNMGCYRTHQSVAVRILSIS